MRTSWPISRRLFLRGAGAALVLPWLESLHSTKAMGGGGKPPVRLGFFYVPNGVVMANWKPAKAGAAFDLPSILKPLEPLKQNVLVLSDLAADYCAHKVASHEPASGALLMGAKCKPSEEPEVAGPSIDQIAAKKLGDQCPIDSLALGIDPGSYGDHGFSGTYLNHISWRDKTTPAALEVNPKALFDRLFRGRQPQLPEWAGGAKAAAAAPKPDSVEQSVLDLVSEDAKSLRSRLGASDRSKLEDYLEGLRGIERRIAQSEREAHPETAKGDAAQPAGEKPATVEVGKGIPKDYAEHVNQMLDILVLAFQTDTTRVASFMFSNEKSGRSYPEIGAPGSHHSTSHHRDLPENLDQLTRINTHHVTLFARMLERMQAIKEGSGTLLDNVVLFYGAPISDGNKHNHDNLPALLAGGAGGTLSGGRHIAYGTKTPICNLWLDMVARAGMPLEKFGDSTGRLSFA